MRFSDRLIGMPIEAGLSLRWRDTARYQKDTYRKHPGSTGVYVWGQAGPVEERHSNQCIAWRKLMFGRQYTKIPIPVNRWHWLTNRY